MGGTGDLSTVGGHAVQIECIVHYPDTEKSTVEKLEEQVTLLTALLFKEEQTNAEDPAL